MRKLIYLVATTADGFIAAPDGSADAFLQQGDHLLDLAAEFPETFPTPVREALRITAQNRMFDAVLMGRSTYDMGARVGLTSPYPQLQQYLFSRSIDASPDPAVELVSGDALAFVRKLKARSGGAIWLCGGGQLASDLFSEIDELILKINPVAIGAGIPLFARAVGPARLRPLARKVYESGVERVHYAVR